MNINVPMVVMVTVAIFGPDQRRPEHHVRRPEQLQHQLCSRVAQACLMAEMDLVGIDHRQLGTRERSPSGAERTG
jgi:hypothetical protein